ncbi:MAG: TlpA family protein disulfide reductase [Ilumatobacteraceae bacterium]
MATSLSPSLVLAPIGHEPRALSEWLTTFHLASVVLDPYTNESSWILPTAARVLRGFAGAAVRVNFVVTANDEDAKAFLGPLAKEFLVFADPDRAVTKGLGLAQLPAFVFVRSDGTVPAVAEGWDPMKWREVARTIADTTSWSVPSIPTAADPAAFAGTPAA